ncbi:hypothetical protein FRGDSA1882_150053 [Flavobacterium psychrophilum]|nr:hypothetical protein FRGDSA1882_150053 [Flavobacterium psychrophilum]SNB01729.1 hypothetical protein IT2_120009 [Flavobacterium psychrophilum]
MQHSSALSVTLACDALNVFWIDTYSLNLYFHTLSIALSSLCYTSDSLLLFLKLVQFNHYFKTFNNDY